MMHTEIRHYLIPMVGRQLVLQVEVHVERDPERVLQGTASWLADAPEHAATFASMHGFSSDTILADRRFRAAERLQVQGLSETQAGRAALMHMHAAAKPRRDCLTTWQQQSR